jgi:hypothetical protein
MMTKTIETTAAKIGRSEILSERSYGAGGGGRGTFIVHTN